MEKTWSYIFWSFVLVSGIIAAVGLYIIRSGSQDILMPMKMSEETIKLPENLDIKAVNASIEETRLDVRYYRSVQSEWILIFFHSGFGNLYDRLDLFNWCADNSISLLIFDYRGFGLSGDTDITEESICEDARKIHTIAATLNWHPDKFLLYGEGTAGSIAASDAAKNNRCAALFIENGAPSIVDLEKNPIKRFLLKGQFNLESKLQSIRIPILFMQSSDHPSISKEMAQRIVHAGAMNKVCTIHDTQGQSLRKADPQAWSACVLDFIGKVAEYEKTHVF